MRSRLATSERVLLGVLIAVQVIVIGLSPSPWPHLDEPVCLATVGGIVAACTMIALRFRSPRAPRLEQLVLALFLAGMPIVYAWTAVRAGDSVPREGAGIAVFGTIAVVGWFRAPWILPIGIAAHGLGWDVWHRGLVVPVWYADGCLLLDLALAGFAAAQLAADRARWQLSRSSDTFGA